MQVNGHITEYIDSNELTGYNNYECNTGNHSFCFWFRRDQRGSTIPPPTPSTKFFHLDSFAYRFLISFHARAPLVDSAAKPSRHAASAGVSASSSAAGGSSGTIRDIRFTLRQPGAGGGGVT